MQTISFFKDEDLEETFASQTQIIQTLQHANLEVHSMNEKLPQLRKQAEINFEQAQHTLTRLSDDLKAIHLSIKRIKELNLLISEKKQQS